uniref:Alternative protein NPHP3 n=1 Tax=Homo sapiens TaxID=9606 RepID=L8E9N9_HUMAN|nr:alternative protein NPHP3 [Homo sapiens]
MILVMFCGTYMMNKSKWKLFSRLLIQPMSWDLRNITNALMI